MYLFYVHLKHLEHLIIYVLPNDEKTITKKWGRPWNEAYFKVLNLFLQEVEPIK
jgi:hypothetical protein